MAEDDFEIKEIGEYNYNKDEKYSHSSLLMTALKSCQEKRSKEMRDGYFNIKFDRVGNAHRVWIPDSREEFIESVEALIMMQERDYDEPSIDAVKKIQEDLENKYKKYCELEKQEWEAMPYEITQKHLSNGIFHREGMLTDVLPYKFLFNRDKIKAYTNIVSIIQKLIKSLGDYKEEIWEN